MATIDSISNGIDELTKNSLEYNKDIPRYHTGMQRFISSLKYHHFIPGVSYEDYTSVGFPYDFSLCSQNTPAGFMVAEFKKYLSVLDEFLISKPVEDFSVLGKRLTADLQYQEVIYYLHSFKYPNSIDDLFSESDDEVSREKKKDEVSIWMMLIALNYCIETLPKSVKYKTKPQKFKNHDLQKAIIDSISIGGIFSKVQKKGVKDVVSGTLSKYYDTHPLPGKRTYDEYRNLVSAIVDDYDYYCEHLLHKWDDISSRIFKHSSKILTHDYSSNDVKVAKDFIFMLSLLDIVSRCQRDIMARFTSYKDIAYAISPFFNKINTAKLIEAFESNDGYYDLNDYPDMRFIMLSEFTTALNNMLSKDIMKSIDSKVKGFKYHILKRCWLHETNNVVNPSMDDIEDLKRCARQCALYFIFINGGYISSASIIYDADGNQLKWLAPIFGRRLTD